MVCLYKLFDIECDSLDFAFWCFTVPKFQEGCQTTPISQLIVMKALGDPGVRGFRLHSLMGSDCAMRNRQWMLACPD